MKRLAEGTLKSYKKDDLIILINDLYDELEMAENVEEQIVKAKQIAETIVSAKIVDEVMHKIDELKGVKFGLVSDKTKNLIHQDTLNELKDFIAEQELKHKYFAEV